MRSHLHHYKGVISWFFTILQNKCKTSVGRREVCHAKENSILKPGNQNEIAALVKQSFTASQIAERLGLSIRTVEKHPQRIYFKTETTSWEELRNL